MSTDIHLVFINRSNERNDTEIVIFQKDMNAHLDNSAIAWQVIRNCGQGDRHPFVYSSEMSVSASDSWGNFTPHLAAQNGDAFQMIKNDSGDILRAAGAGSSPEAVQIQNGLTAGAISASVYKDGRLLARKSSIAPQQEAAFEFKPTIWVGVASRIQEGQVLEPAIIDSVNTEISLLGIASADIVMSEGGSGPDAMPFRFSLENIKFS